ncbi:Putative transcription factor [Echinococcus granulosus]|uniref:Transcription factor n=2 Tax=Echinococcus granulosus TaxID=6210 RepID=W6UMK8_ECHGR|nr:Putative transcription factor [Echinococcus granulosus]EUB62780.1 Putative transcription factor [Echinococcus granulosus]
MRQSGPASTPTIDLQRPRICTQAYDRPPMQPGHNAIGYSSQANHSHSQMASAQDSAERILPSRAPLMHYSPLNQNDDSKMPCKLEGPGNESKRKVKAGSASLFAYSVAEFNECSRCEKARLTGLDAWMEHLGQVHTFPSRWPSSKIDDGLMDKGHPYTSVVDSHKKRRTAGVPRPLNSFMIFAQYIRRLTLSSFPDAPNVHISQQVGRLWRNLSNDFREVYAKEARRLQSLHSLEFPDYKYQPRRRLRTLDGDEIDCHSSPLRPATNPPPSNPNIINHYFDELLQSNRPKCQLKPSPLSELGSKERPDFTDGLLDFSVLRHNPNVDTLTPLQSANGQRDAIKHQLEDSITYQPTFNYPATTDGAADRLGWLDDRSVEPFGLPTQAQALVTAPSYLQPENIFSSTEHWHQYHKEGSFGDVLPLPGIETWTFSGSTI